MDCGNSGARDDRALRVGDHADDGSGGHALGVDKWRSHDGQPPGSHRCTHTPQQLRTHHFHTLLRGLPDEVLKTTGNSTVRVVTRRKKTRPSDKLSDGLNPNDWSCYGRA